METVTGWFRGSYGNRVIIINKVIIHLCFWGVFMLGPITDTVRVRQEGIQGLMDALHPVSPAAPRRAALCPPGLKGLNALK